ncbi:hypothetical protein IscW_ISCW005627 [Ixodes scapularis]|uniref:Uncharacterized protein n=1 Tax=Ixodes scapularis TaxID=6945 RepID=B7PMX2_IXOSC|nr:hypothetical protein IscW_ISCW005627 [Ixodes scapularis]|eukprot:XP_002435120.1 hypothetical protein IscW_ISCW005627 [Ixodes scapularis]
MKLLFFSFQRKCRQSLVYQLQHLCNWPQTTHIEHCPSLSSAKCMVEPYDTFSAHRDGKGRIRVRFAQPGK